MKLYEILCAISLNCGENSAFLKVDSSFLIGTSWVDDEVDTEPKKRESSHKRCFSSLTFVRRGPFLLLSTSYYLVMPLSTRPTTFYYGVMSLLSTLLFLLPAKFFFLFSLFLLSTASTSSQLLSKQTANGNCDDDKKFGSILWYFEFTLAIVKVISFYLSTVENKSMSLPIKNKSSSIFAGRQQFFGW